MEGLPLPMPMHDCDAYTKFKTVSFFADHMCIISLAEIMLVIVMCVHVQGAAYPPHSGVASLYC